jgi:hypothetical protein
LEFGSKHPIYYADIDNNFLVHIGNMCMEKTWREAIIRVLKESATALHYSDIAEQILTNGYYKTDGATPADTVNSHISSSIKAHGEQSPYVRVSPGVFSLRVAQATVPTLADVSTKPEAKNSQQDIDTPATFINSFGMYRQRDLVIWKKNPKLYGRSPGGLVSINFSGQRGVYLLYDHHTPIYVGRSTDQTISQRLYQHTLGRLAGRWNRFSWFGILAATDEGALKEVSPVINESVVFSAFEALLIESLEPPQNRRQGDGFAGCEYVQDIDPEIKKQRLAATLRAIEQKLNDE